MPIPTSSPSSRRSGVVFNSLIKRLHFGTSWAEGPAWNGVGRYMVWSDIPANVQMRWIEDDNRVTTFRNPAGNGNTFDFEGRQLSCEHSGRRVARYEANGQVTVIADTFEGKRLNSPNDVVVHPDGSIWFTDPSWGIRGNYEGNKAPSETRRPSTGSIRRRRRSPAWRRATRTCRTACASRPTTRSSTWRTARSGSTTSTARR